MQTVIKNAIVFHPALCHQPRPLSSLYIPSVGSPGRTKNNGCVVTTKCLTKRPKHVKVKKGDMRDENENEKKPKT